MLYKKIKRIQGPSQQAYSSPGSNPKSKLNPYQVLGIKKNASKVDIKKAYIKRMAEYHPDKVEHLGDDLKDLAKQKVKDINWAKEQLLN